VHEPLLGGSIFRVCCAIEFDRTPAAPLVAMLDYSRTKTNGSEANWNADLEGSDIYPVGNGAGHCGAAGLVLATVSASGGFVRPLVG
jgi:hypothetical protein